MKKVVISRVLITTFAKCTGSQKSPSVLRPSVPFFAATVQNCIARDSRADLWHNLRMDTVALDYSLWDLTVDQYGNWATVGDATPGDATGPAIRMAQDVATRCLTWYGELYYDATQGIRYSNILGQAPNLTLVQNSFTTQALKVSDVVQATADFTFANRTVAGTITTTDISGNSSQVLL
jgi:hypothetical protein